MNKLARLHQARAALVDLRGSQDQTMRCGINAIMFGPARGGLNETQRALEWWIAFVEKGIAERLTDLFDEE